MSKIMAPISDEEHNHILLSLLLNGLALRAVQTFFDNAFPPANLPSTLRANYNTLCELKLRRTLNQPQWDLLFPTNKDVTNSMTFDVTLMVCLIRHLTPIIPPIKGFDSLPLRTEIIPGSDLATIKWYRNKLSHRNSTTVDNAYFTEAWGRLSDAVGRLGGQMMKQECEELKTKILDPSNQELLTIFGQSQKEMQEMRNTIDNMQQNVGCLRTSYDNFKKHTNKSLKSKKNKRGDSTSSADSKSSVDELSTHQTSSSRAKSRIDRTSTKHEAGVRNPVFEPDSDDSEHLAIINNTTNIFSTELSIEDHEPTLQSIGEHSGLSTEDHEPTLQSIGEHSGLSIEDHEPTFQCRGEHSERSIEDHQPPLPCIGEHSGRSNEDHQSTLQCIWTKSKRTITVIAVCLSIVGALVFTLFYKHILGLGGLDISNDPENTNVLLTQDPCEKDVPITLIGQRICIPYTQKLTGSGRYPSFIHVRQLSSKYLRAPKVFSFDMSSATFEQQKGDLIVSFNPSRHDQQYRFVLEKATCENVGKYEITIEYSDGNKTSFVIEIVLEETELNQSVARINDSIHVHCEMTNNCKTVSLGLIVNDGESSRLIPDTNECRNNEKKNSSTITADAIVPVSWFSGNQTISCIPLMTDPELAGNLTSTMGIPVCEGYDCEPNCKDNLQGIAYYGDKDFCHIFYQCSNGDTILQNCSNGTSWSHNVCNCVHFDNTICDWTTHRFIKPAVSFEKCTKT